MLTEVRHLYTLDGIDTRKSARRLDQQIDNRAAPFHIARRRLHFNQRLDERLDLRLPRLQRIKNLTCNHLIVSLRTVSASIRLIFTLNPSPCASVTFFVPRSLTFTFCSMMSSSQYRALAETSPGKVKP